MTSVAQAEPEAEVLPRDEVSDFCVEAIPGRRRVLTGTRNALQLVVRLTTPPSDASQVRPPLCIACVMDCSGSMSGEKLRFAKKAVLKLVKHLTPRDTLHFVTYDTDTRVVFQNGDLSDAGKEDLGRQIERVSAGGATNLCGGLEIAASLLGASEDAVGDSEAVHRRIFIFSDGRVNRGVQDPNEIKRKVAAWAAAGIHTGSFGIGADFDEPLMRGIASSGQGRYQFLGTAQDIPKLVSKSVHDLMDLYASDAVLDLRGGEHTTVSRVYGGHGDEDMAGTAGLLHIGDIHSDNMRGVLVEIEVAPPGGVQQGVEFNAVEWILTFQRNGSPVRLSGQVQLGCTRDRDALGEETPSVRLAFAVRRATDLEREVAEHLSRRDRQRAREVKAQQIALLEQSLAAAQQTGNAEGELRREVELLNVVLDRARQIAARLEDDREDEELMARQCWQDRDDYSCASVCGIRERCNSSASGGDVGDLRDFANISPPLSPRSGSGSSVGSPRGSPRGRCATPARSPARSVSSGSLPSPCRSRSPSPTQPPSTQPPSTHPPNTQRSSMKRVSDTGCQIC